MDVAIVETAERKSHIGYQDRCYHKNSEETHDCLR